MEYVNQPMEKPPRIALRIAEMSAGMIDAKMAKPAPAALPIAGPVLYAEMEYAMVLKLRLHVQVIAETLLTNLLFAEMVIAPHPKLAALVRQIAAAPVLSILATETVHVTQVRPA